MAVHWKSFMGGYPGNVVAMKVPKGQIKGFFKKDIIIEPGEAAVLIKDGRIEEELTQTKLKSFGGGLGGWLERVTGKGEDELLLFVDTNPIDLELPVAATSKDYTNIQGACTVRCQVNLGEAMKLIGLMKGKDVLTKTELQNKVHSEMAATVFSSNIAKYTADEFHGNLNIIKDMETNASIEMRKTFELWGIKLIKMYTNWGKSAFDELMEYRKVWEMYDAKRDVVHESKIKEMERDHGIIKKRAEQAHDLTFTGEMNEIEVKRLKEDYALEVDKRKRTQEILLIKEEKRAEVDMQAMEFDQDKKEIEEALKWKEEMQRQKMARQAQEADLQVKVYQGTELESKKLDSSVETEKARMDAEKAKYNMDTYERAQDREKKHQLDMTEQMSKLMQASKQNVPQTLVQGGNPQPVVGIQAQQGQQPQNQCPGCKASVQTGMQFCPHCGSKMS